ncbi:MAG: hypothetical protein ACM3MK_00520 [Chitinophagales bacterium]
MRPISSGGLGQLDVELPATTILDLVLDGYPPPAKQAAGVAGEETRSEWLLFQPEEGTNVLRAILPQYVMNGLIKYEW